ncbi:MAG: DUF6206 family protein [Candidatus Hodarchaeota archaeon]
MGINIELLRKLEETIDTLYPERGQVPIKILGFGEISLVFELKDGRPIAYKRLPIFDSETQVKRHVMAYNKYQEILEKKIGINVPPYDSIWFTTPEKKVTLYCSQEKLPPDSLGHRVIHQMSKKNVRTLVLLLMREMKKVWEFNKRSKSLEVGLDGQISNWSIVGFDPNNPKITYDTELLYLDTSTPFFRLNGVEAMEPVLFLKSAPSFLRWLLKVLYLQEVIDRYYDWRLVIVDLIANFYKEQRPELIPELIKTVNNFFSNEGSEFHIPPLSLEEVHSYYQGDKEMWKLFQTTRRMDRYFKTRMLRKKYDFYLPPNIKR